MAGVASRLRSPERPLEPLLLLPVAADLLGTICTAIAVGGGVDTTAAMAGALSGAHLGLAALPAGAASRLNDRGTWTHADLVQLADTAHAPKISGAFEV